MRSEAKRVNVGERDQYVIYGFDLRGISDWILGKPPFVLPHLTGKVDKTGRDTGWESFWTALRVLTRTGVVETVYHLVESTKSEAEILHPYAIAGGEPAELSLRKAAHRAGLAMSADWLREEHTGLFLVPVMKHLANVELVGIFRMRHRPKTKATAAWWKGNESWSMWEKTYEELRQQADGSVANGNQKTRKTA
jgi:hypothetical protein